MKKSLLFAFAILWSHPVLSQPLPDPPVSPMQVEWKTHFNGPWERWPPVPYGIAEPLALEKAEGFQVLGYLPYWKWGDTNLVLHLDQLDVIAYFGVAVLADGSLGDAHHWGTAGMSDLVADAHEAGVKVIITAVNFEPGSIHGVLSSPAIRAKAVNNLVDLVVDQGGDGVNVDFEGLPVEDKAAFVDFVISLKQALDQALGDSHVSVATPAVDWVGAFAVTAGHGTAERIAEMKERLDDYDAIMLEALANRLAEAFAERLHQRVRKELWGYASDEQLANEELVGEAYRGIRPAPGYPACPDHTEKATLWKLLDVERNTGIELTDTFAMYPAASVSGWYFAHPDAKYFQVGKIARDQAEDYARRKGLSLATIERWLAANLGYDAEAA